MNAATVVLILGSWATIAVPVALGFGRIMRATSDRDIAAARTLADFAHTATAERQMLVRALVAMTGRNEAMSLAHVERAPAMTEFRDVLAGLGNEARNDLPAEMVPVGFE